MDTVITEFSVADYDEARLFWLGTEGLGRDLEDADSRSGMKAYVKWNPGISFVARSEGKLVGAVLCGHDRRRGYLHHLAVMFKATGLGRRAPATCR